MSGPGRVLITGRHGFTGEYAAAELEAAGWDVWGTGVSQPPEENAQFLQADLDDPDALARVIDSVRPTAVLHLAAIAFVAHGKAEDFYRVNVIGTRHLLDALTRAEVSPSAVVLASSANIYGNSDISPISETTAAAPVNDYAVSKLAMEYVARLFLDRLPIVLARPFNYTGRGQDPKFLIPKIISHFQDQAKQIELGNLDVARDFSDVRDVAKTYRALLEHPPIGQTVNICSGAATPLEAIVNTCRELTGHDIAVTVNPAFVRANEVKTLTGDPSRLNALVELGPRNTLSDTLRWMLLQ